MRISNWQRGLGREKWALTQACVVCTTNKRSCVLFWWVKGSKVHYQLYANMSIPTLHRKFGHSCYLVIVVVVSGWNKVHLLPDDCSLGAKCPGCCLFSAESLDSTFGCIELLEVNCLRSCSLFCFPSTNRHPHFKPPALQLNSLRGQSRGRHIGRVKERKGRVTKKIISINNPSRLYLFTTIVFLFIQQSTAPSTQIVNSHIRLSCKTAHTNPFAPSTQLVPPLTHYFCIFCLIFYVADNNKQSKNHEVLRLTVTVAPSTALLPLPRPNLRPLEDRAVSVRALSALPVHSWGCCP